MKFTAVIVFYKQKIETSKTFRSFINLISSKQDIKSPIIELILYDNSPESQHFDPAKYSQVSVHYVHDKRNLGISTAYNYALQKAKKCNSEWLILFDHDTEVTGEYVDQIFHLPKVDSKVVAIVPQITTGNQWVSPVYSSSLRPLTGQQPSPGIQSVPVMAINSGAVIKVAFLEEIGGFNEEFPLDYLDHWLFYEIYAKNYKTFVLDIYLHHDLSVMDYNSISLTRYKSILHSEFTFYKKYKRELFPEYRKQLFKRLLKQIITVKNKKIALYTLRMLLSLKGD